MNTKYHFSPITGKMERCTNPENCRYGGLHFEDPNSEEAMDYVDFNNRMNLIQIDSSIPKNQISIRKVLQNLNLKGAQTYLVGGCVRDEIIGNKEIKDFDIEIYNIEPEEFQKIASEYGKIELVGKQFGVYKFKGKEKNAEDVDFSFPRTERKNGIGHKGFDIEVNPYTSTKIAAQRRDFTFNSIMKDTISGEYIDNYSGIDDIKNKIIKVVNPHTFIEDPLRVYRAAQFSSRFGFNVDPDTIELCKSMNIENLPKERVVEEFNKAMLKGKKPSNYFNFLHEIQKEQLYFEMKFDQNKIQELDYIKKYEAKNNIKFPISVYYAHLISNELNDPNITKKLYKFHKNLLVNKQIEDFNKITLFSKNKNTKKDLFYLFESSNEYSIDYGCMFYNWNKQEKQKEFIDYKKALKEIPSGDDLIKLGFKPGKEFGEILKIAKDNAFSGMKKNQIINSIINYNKL